MQQASRRFNRKGKALSQANIPRPQRYDWPGNVRELLNVIERAVITSGAGAIRLDLPQASSNSARKTAPTPASPPVTVVPDAEMKRRERENILAALHQTNWQVHGPGGAAELLELRPTTLASRIKRMGLTRTG